MIFDQLHRKQNICIASDWLNLFNHYRSLRGHFIVTQFLQSSLETGFCVCLWIENAQWNSTFDFVITKSFSPHLHFLWYQGGTRKAWTFEHGSLGFGPWQCHCSSVWIWATSRVPLDMTESSVFQGQKIAIVSYLQFLALRLPGYPGCSLYFIFLKWKILVNQILSVSLLPPYNVQNWRPDTLLIQPALQPFLSWCYTRQDSLLVTLPQPAWGTLGARMCHLCATFLPGALPFCVPKN